MVMRHATASSRRGLPTAAMMMMMMLTMLPLLSAAAAPQTPEPIVLSFSGSGFLALFEVGVLAQLQDLGLATRATPVAGTSGGSLVAGISCLGLTAARAEWVGRSLVEHCVRAPWRSCAGSLDGAVRAAVALAVDTAYADARAVGEPDAAGDRDAFVRARCSSGAAVAYISRLVSAADNADEGGSGSAAAAAATAATTTTSQQQRTEAWAVSDFAGVDDFVAAGAASSYIPFFSGPAAYTLFRGQRAMDGGFKQMLPPCPPGAGAGAGDGAATCVRVSAVVSGAAVVPGMPKPAPDAEISPGKYGALPLGMSAEDWGAYALMAPGDEAVVAAILQHGRDMALAWAKGARPEAVAAATSGGASSSGGGSGNGKRRTAARRLLLLF